MNANTDNTQPVCFIHCTTCHSPPLSLLFKQSSLLLQPSSLHNTEHKWNRTQAIALHSLCTLCFIHCLRLYYLRRFLSSQNHPSYTTQRISGITHKQSARSTVLEVLHSPCSIHCTSFTVLKLLRSLSPALLFKKISLLLQPSFLHNTEYLYYLRKYLSPEEHYIYIYNPTDSARWALTPDTLPLKIACFINEHCSSRLSCRDNYFESGQSSFLRNTKTDLKSSCSLALFWVLYIYFYIAIVFAQTSPAQVGLSSEDENSDAHDLPSVGNDVTTVSGLDLFKGTIVAIEDEMVYMELFHAQGVGTLVMSDRRGSSTFNNPRAP